jgi:hypothetical protein
LADPVPLKQTIWGIPRQLIGKGVALESRNVPSPADATGRQEMTRQGTRDVEQDDEPQRGLSLGGCRLECRATTQLFQPTVAVSEGVTGLGRPGIAPARAGSQPGQCCRGPGHQSRQISPGTAASFAMAFTDSPASTPKLSPRWPSWERRQAAVPGHSRRARTDAVSSLSLSFAERTQQPSGESPRG